MSAPVSPLSVSCLTPVSPVTESKCKGDSKLRHPGDHRTLGQLPLLSLISALQLVLLGPTLPASPVGSPSWWKPLTGDTGPLLGSTPKPPNRLRSYPLPRPRISLTALRNQLLRN